MKDIITVHIVFYKCEKDCYRLPRKGILLGNFLFCRIVKSQSSVTTWIVAFKDSLIVHRNSLIEAGNSLVVHRNSLIEAENSLIRHHNSPIDWLGR